MAKDRTELESTVRRVEELRHELLTLGEDLYNGGYKQEGRTLVTLGNRVDEWIWNSRSKAFRR